MLKFTVQNHMVMFRRTIFCNFCHRMYAYWKCFGWQLSCFYLNVIDLFRFTLKLNMCTGYQWHMGSFFNKFTNCHSKGNMKYIPWPSILFYSEKGVKTRSPKKKSNIVFTSYDFNSVNGTFVVFCFFVIDLNSFNAFGCLMCTLCWIFYFLICYFLYSGSCLLA